MKNLVTIAVVVVVGLVAYNYFQTGEFSLLPKPMSEDASELNGLKGEFRRAAQEFRQAGRSAGLSGMDTTSAAGAAVASLDGIEKDLRSLKKKTDEPEVKSGVDELLAEIAKFKRDIQ